MPASGGTVGRTPCEGLLGRQATLGVFRRFGYRFWVHAPGKPFDPAVSLICVRGLGVFSGLISLFGQECIRRYWTVGRSRSRRRSSWMMRPTCLLQYTCLMWRHSSSCGGRGIRGSGIWTATVIAKTKCKCTRTGCVQQARQSPGKKCNGPRRRGSNSDGAIVGHSQCTGSAHLCTSSCRRQLLWIGSSKHNSNSHADNTPDINLEGWSRWKSVAAHACMCFMSIICVTTLSSVALSNNLCVSTH
jgi:hypothetical protein